MSLINREDLLAAIMNDSGLQHPKWWYIDKIKTAPEAVIHCEDCILHGVCTYERGLGEDGFCNQGKRGEDDRCYECTGYGDDYELDENGNLVSVCPKCPYNPIKEADDGRPD